MKYVHIEVGNLDNWDADASDKIMWFAENCIGYEKNKGRDGVYSFWFKFGSDDAYTEFRTEEFGLTRADVRNFLVAYLNNIWGEDSDYNIDSLFFASDGDGEDCMYVVKTEVYKRYGKKD